jgi:hypothetical protein
VSLQELEAGLTGLQVSCPAKPKKTGAVMDSLRQAFTKRPLIELLNLLSLATVDIPGFV